MSRRGYVIGHVRREEARYARQNPTPYTPRAPRPPRPPKTQAQKDAETRAWCIGLGLFLILATRGVLLLMALIGYGIWWLYKWLRPAKPAYRPVNHLWDPTHTYGVTILPSQERSQPAKGEQVSE